MIVTVSTAPVNPSQSAVNYAANNGAPDSNQNNPEASSDKTKSSSVSKEVDSEGSGNLKKHLISSGAVDGSLPQGSFLNLRA